MMRGKVTAVDARGVFVQTADYGVLGPCQWFGSAPGVASSVLVADVGDPPAPELVVVGQSGGLFGQSGAGGPSGISAPVGSTWRQTDANSSHGNLTGLLWNKVGTGIAEGTDWLVDYEGRWINYNPTWTGTGGTPSVGNGYVAGMMTRSGTTASFVLEVGFGSTTTGNASTAWQFTYPVAAANWHHAHPVYMVDAGSLYYTGVAHRVSSTTFNVVCSGLADPVGSTVPMTWASGDVLSVAGTYRIA